jgi:hypothetical protein
MAGVWVVFLFCSQEEMQVMVQLSNVLDILKLLNKSNCRECGELTCMAFAACVHKGDKDLGSCPHLAPEVLAQYGNHIQKRRNSEQDAVEAMAQLKAQIVQMDFESAAQRVGGQFSRGRLTLKILGKDFSVDENGNLFSDIHVNSWVSIPFLNYVLHGKGTVPSGDWIPFRELKGGPEMYGLFAQQCEKRLKKVADGYPGLFEDMLNIFSGKQVERHYASDISLVLYPLPRVPVLICYWKPEDGMASDLSIFFDAKVEDNLLLESVYALCTGMSRMFENIVKSHGAV